MSRPTLSSFIVVAIAVGSALAQIDPNDPIPLTSKTYAYPSGIPYQVDPVTNAIRGPQYGYNECNSSTENQESLCQTIFENGIGDFCLWGPPKLGTISDYEGEVVGYCSQPGRGTRLIQAGAIQGVQGLNTSKYFQLVGFLDQTVLDIIAGDYGGELDPNGADLRGNPIGGLVYSTYFGDGIIQQIIRWTVFIGGNFFCLTICNPDSPLNDQLAYCQNRYDRMGCEYNMPNNAKNGTFEVCDADLKTPVGVYVTGGATSTYTQPFSGSLSVPYTPVVPKSSNCVTYQSSALYTALPTITTATGTSSAPSATANSATSALGISSVAGILGTLFAVAFLS